VCKVTLVTLHGVVSPDRSDFTQCLGAWGGRKVCQEAWMLQNEHTTNACLFVPALSCVQFALFFFLLLPPLLTHSRTLQGYLANSQGT
jgi:hypothetical protein